MNAVQSLFTTSNATVSQLLLKGRAVIIDVRTPREFKAGHIDKSYNFPLNTLVVNVKTLQSFGKPLVLVSQTGKHSQQAQNLLSEKGIECYNFGSWQELKHTLQTEIKSDRIKN